MEYAIPNTALDDRLGIVGTSGSGKTYTTCGLVERVLRSSSKAVIVDPLGVWWGLRLKADGKSPAFPVVIFGGKHADLPLTERSGAVIGETVASMAESCIIDLSELETKSAERRFMLAFLERLYRRATGEPFHLIFDEADLWAPQKSTEPQLQNLMEQIVRRGRIKGFIPWLITQRPAVLSKDVLSQVDGLIAMKLTSSQDRDALGAWIEGQADRADEKRMLARLPQMERGQGVVWIPARGLLKEIHFPRKATYDSSSTPRRGESQRTATLKPIDLVKVKDRLSAAEAEQSKPKGKAVPVAAAPAPDMKAALAAAREEAFRAGKAAGMTEGFALARALAVQAVTGIKSDVVGAAPAPKIPKTAQLAAAWPTPERAPRAVEHSIGAERKPLSTLAQASPGGLTESQWATLTGLKRTSGTWSTYKSRLRSADLIEQRGNLWFATPAGLKAIGEVPSAPATLEERLAMWRKATGAASKLLDVLVEAFPLALTRQDLASRCSLEPSSGTFSTYVSRLSGNGLINKEGTTLRASEDLFVGLSA
jgi:hypothetical protein